jgi:ABC-type proline/glycine betaine transport system permease subunit
MIDLTIQIFLKKKMTLLNTRYRSFVRFIVNFLEMIDDFSKGWLRKFGWNDITICMVYVMICTLEYYIDEYMMNKLCYIGL